MTSVQNEINDIVNQASITIQQQLLNLSSNPKNFKKSKNITYINDYLKLQHIYYKIAEHFIRFYEFDSYIPLYNMILYFTDLKNRPEFIKDLVIEKIEEYIIMYSNYYNRLEYNNIWRSLCYDFNIHYDFEIELLPQKKLNMNNLNVQQKQLIHMFITKN